MTYLKDNPLTAFLLLLTTIVAVAGAVVVAVNPDTLTFNQYLDDLKTFTVGLGLLGIGHGVKVAGERAVQAQTIASMEGDPTDDKAV